MKNIKRYLALASIVAILALSTIAIAQVSMPQTRIKTLGVLGEGLAISSTNSADFKVVRIGIAKVSVEIAGTSNDLTVGVLFLDSDKYAVKNISQNNDTASGDIYLNNTQVGSLSLSRVVKPGRDVWYGTLNVNSVSYYAYIVQAPRSEKASEAAANIKDLCSDNPEKCASTATSIKGIGNICNKENSNNCSNKIQQYCSNHPTDQRCVSLFRVYCSEHMEDERCITELKLFCSKNPNNENCKDFCSKHPNVCSAAISPSTEGVNASTETNENGTNTAENTTISQE
jgi:hypothetical protein